MCGAFANAGSHVSLHLILVFLTAAAFVQSGAAGNTTACVPTAVGGSVTVNTPPSPGIEPALVSLPSPPYGPTTQASRKFFGAVYDGLGGFWSAPHRGTHALRVDTATGRTDALQPPGIASTTMANGPYYVDLVLDPTRRQLWLVPSNVPTIPLLRLNLTSDRATGFVNGTASFNGFPTSGLPQFSAFGGGTFDAAGDALWLIPLHGAALVRVDPGSGSMRYVGADWGGAALGSAAETSGRFMQGVLDLGRRVLWLPPAAAVIGIRVDLHTEQVLPFALGPLQRPLTYAYRFMAGVHDPRHDCVWLLPMVASAAVESYYAESAQVRSVHSILSAVSDVAANFDAQHFQGQAFDGQAIWLAPFNSPLILRFDTVTGLASSAALPPGFQTDATTDPRKGSRFVSAAFDGTRVYLVPYDATQLVIIGPAFGGSSGDGAAAAPPVSTAPCRVDGDGEDANGASTVGCAAASPTMAEAASSTRHPPLWLASPSELRAALRPTAPSQACSDVLRAASVTGAAEGRPHQASLVAANGTHLALDACAIEAAQGQFVAVRLVVGSNASVTLSRWRVTLADLELVFEGGGAASVGDPRRSVVEVTANSLVVIDASRMPDGTFVNHALASSSHIGSAAHGVAPSIDLVVHDSVIVGRQLRAEVALFASIAAYKPPGVFAGIIRLSVSNASILVEDSVAVPVLAAASFILLNYEGAATAVHTSAVYVRVDEDSVVDCTVSGPPYSISLASVAAVRHLATAITAPVPWSPGDVGISVVGPARLRAQRVRPDSAQRMNTIIATVWFGSPVVDAVVRSIDVGVGGNVSTIILATTQGSAAATVASVVVISSRVDVRGGSGQARVRVSAQDMTAAIETASTMPIGIGVAAVLVTSSGTRLSLSPHGSSSLEVSLERARATFTGHSTGDAIEAVAIAALAVTDYATFEVVEAVPSAGLDHSTNAPSRQQTRCLLANSTVHLMPTSSKTLDAVGLGGIALFTKATVTAPNMNASLTIVDSIVEIESVKFFSAVAAAGIALRVVSVIGIGHVRGAVVGSVVRLPSEESSAIAVGGLACKSSRVSMASATSFEVARSNVSVESPKGDVLVIAGLGTRATGTASFHVLGDVNIALYNNSNVTTEGKNVAVAGAFGIADSVVILGNLSVWVSDSAVASTLAMGAERGAVFATSGLLSSSLRAGACCDLVGSIDTCRAQAVSIGPFANRITTNSTSPGSPNVLVGECCDDTVVSSRRCPRHRHLLWQASCAASAAPPLPSPPPPREKPTTATATRSSMPSATVVPTAAILPPPQQPPHATSTPTVTMSEESKRPATATTTPTARAAVAAVSSTATSSMDPAVRLTPDPPLSERLGATTTATRAAATVAATLTLGTGGTASRPARMGAVGSLRECSGEAPEAPSYLELPLQGTALDNDDAEEADKLATTVAAIAVVHLGLILVCLGVACVLVRQQVGFPAAAEALVSVPISYLAPTLAEVAATWAPHGGALLFAVAGGGSAVSLLALWAVANKFATAATGGIASETESAGLAWQLRLVRPLLQQPSAGEQEEGADAPTPSILVRDVFFIETACGVAFAALCGIQRADLCSSRAWGAVIVSFGFVVYLAACRPHTDRVEFGFAITFAVVQLVCAVLMGLSIEQRADGPETPNEAETSSAALADAADALALLGLLLVFVQAVVMLGVAFVRSRRGESDADDHHNGKESGGAPLLELPPAAAAGTKQPLVAAAHGGGGSSSGGGGDGVDVNGMEVRRVNSGDRSSGMWPPPSQPSIANPLLPPQRSRGNLPQ